MRQRKSQSPELVEVEQKDGPSKRNADVNIVPRITLLLALAQLLFWLLPPVLNRPLPRILGPKFREMNIGEALESVSLPILACIFYKLLSSIPTSSSSRPQSSIWTYAFIMFACIMVYGQGMHLSGNSIAHHTKILLRDAGRHDALISQMNRIHRLADWYDEKLGHYVWHLGHCLLVALCLLKESFFKSQSDSKPTGSSLLVFSGFLLSIVFFCMTVEGATKYLCVPFAAVVSIYCLASLFITNRTRHQPLAILFGTSSTISSIAFAIWYQMNNRRFPEFSELGWL